MQIIVPFFLLLLSIQNSFAKENYTLDIGLGAGLLSFPEYVGSDYQKTYVAPYPYVYYKSDKYLIEDNRFFNHLYKKNNFFIDLSMGGSFPVKNDEESNRKGLEELDPTLGIGVSLKYRILDQYPYIINLELPVQGVFRTDFTYAKHTGYSFEPLIRLNYFHNGFKYYLRGGLKVVSQKYHQYFYGVSKDNSASYDEYTASSGYSHFWSSLGLSGKIHKSYRLGAYVKYYNLSGSTIEDSPLVTTKENFFFATALTYLF